MTTNSLILVDVNHILSLGVFGPSIPSAHVPTRQLKFPLRFACSWGSCPTGFELVPCWENRKRRFHEWIWR